MSKKILQLFVDGSFIESKSHFLLESFGEDVEQYEVPNCDILTTVHCIQVAQKAFHSPTKKDLAQRIPIFENFYKYLESVKYQLADELSKFLGLSAKAVLDFEIEPGLSSFREALSQLQRLQTSNQNSEAQASGLVVILVPAILSFKSACERLAPALLAGNTVLIKFSQKNPLVGDWIAKAAQASGLEPGFLNVLFGQSKTIGNLLTSHPSVRAISFAGTLKNAEAIIRSAAPQFKKLQLSTTTKNVAVVLSDANLEAAVVQILEGSLFYSGQSPFSIHRIYVVEAVASAFIERLKVEVEKIIPLQETSSSGLGSMAFNLLTSTEEYENLKATALSAHAKILSPPTKFPAGYLSPIFTLDMTNCSTLQQDELRAPLIVLSTVKYQHEVQKYANVGYYGSKAFIFGSKEKCEKVMQQLQATEFVFNAWQVPPGPLVSSRQSFFGDSNFNVFGSFYSDLKKINLV